MWEKITAYHCGLIQLVYLLGSACLSGAHRLIIEWGAGLVILALKHKTTIDEIQEAVTELGGLQTLAKFQPWLFDFTRKTPQPGYQK